MKNEEQRELLMSLAVKMNLDSLESHVYLKFIHV